MKVPYATPLTTRLRCQTMAADKVSAVSSSCASILDDELYRPLIYPAASRDKSYCAFAVALAIPDVETLTILTVA
jgi:hypothetical protein